MGATLSVVVFFAGAYKLWQLAYFSLCGNTDFTGKSIRGVFFLIKDNEHGETSWTVRSAYQSLLDIGRG